MHNAENGTVYFWCKTQKVRVGQINVAPAYTQGENLYISGRSGRFPRLTGPTAEELKTVPPEACSPPGDFLCIGKDSIDKRSRM